MKKSEKKNCKKSKETWKKKKHKIAINSTNVLASGETLNWDRKMMKLVSFSIYILFFFLCEKWSLIWSWHVNIKFFGWPTLGRLFWLSWPFHFSWWWKVFFIEDKEAYKAYKIHCDEKSFAKFKLGRYCGHCVAHQLVKFESHLLCVSVQG